jgi:hypothetical protein
VSPGATDQAAQYAAFLAQQEQMRQQAAQAAQLAAQAPVAPTPTPAMDPQYAAFLASQQPAAAPMQAAPVYPAAAPMMAPPQAPQFLAPPGMPAAPTSGGTDPFDDPAPQRPKGPRLEEMYGRLLIIIPKGMERVSGKDSDGKPNEYDRMTADVVVLDGGPIAFGGDPNGRPPVPHDQLAQVPHRNVAMFLSAKGIISQCRDAWAKRQRGEPGMVLGRLTVGERKNPQHQPPWLLDKATEADRALGRAYTAAIDPFA